MDILITVTNTTRKSLVFITKTLNILSLSEMMDKVKNGVFEKVYLVAGRRATYIRSTPDKTLKNNIDSCSITGPQLMAIIQGHANSTPAISSYLELYFESLSEGAPYIEPIDSFRIPSAIVRRVFQSHVDIINKSAQEFHVDRYLLSAIIIDEIARLAPFEPIMEKLRIGIIGKDTSVGVAQVTLDTAHRLIRLGLYNPDPKDKNLPFRGQLTNANREYLYKYVVDPQHNIRFATVLIKNIIDTLSKKMINTQKNPDIVATFYSRILKSDSELRPSKRGKQIANEFYAYAKKWLN